MSFPITHLRVADLVALKLNLPDPDAATFLLGALAPDGVHYRPGLVGASQPNIGATKKASHLCPPGDEPWGQVTDNAGWVAEVQSFLRQHPGDLLAAGYAVHVLTDIYTNISIWIDFRKNFPEEAAKGYKSEYYREMADIDLFFYQEAASERMLRLLPTATARDFPGRVTAEEIHAIRDSLFAEYNETYTTYLNQPPADPVGNKIVTLAQMQRFLEEAAVFSLARIYV